MFALEQAADVGETPGNPDGTRLREPESSRGEQHAVEFLALPMVLAMSQNVVSGYDFTQQVH